jgi:soluble lytic murein transglycosylase-like protein
MKFTPLPLGILRNLLALAVLFGACTCARPALAGALYKCAGPNGQVAYTNRPKTFGDCKVVSTYVDKPAPRHAAEDKPRSEYHSEAADTFANVISDNTAPASAPASTQVSYGAVYKVAKSNGITEYTNVRPNRGAAYRVLFTYIANCYACDVHSKINFGAIALNVNAYNDAIAAAAQEYGVDAALLRAVIHAESSFNPNAVSMAGAQGLMQLMPGTANDLGVQNPFDSTQNIRGGAHYLAQLLKQFNGDERLATAAYNAGPQNVQKYNGVPPFDETRVYVERVATLHQRYRDASPAVPAAVVAAVPIAPRS